MAGQYNRPHAPLSEVLCRIYHRGTARQADQHPGDLLSEAMQALTVTDPAELRTDIDTVRRVMAFLMEITIDVSAVRDFVPSAASELDATAAVERAGPLTEWTQGELVLAVESLRAAWFRLEFTPQLLYFLLALARAIASTYTEDTGRFSEFDGLSIILLAMLQACVCAIAVVGDEPKLWTPDNPAAAAHTVQHVIDSLRMDSDIPEVRKQDFEAEFLEAYFGLRAPVGSAFLEIRKRNASFNNRLLLINNLENGTDRVIEMQLLVGEKTETLLGVTAEDRARRLRADPAAMYTYYGMLLDKYLQNALVERTTARIVWNADLHAHIKEVDRGGGRTQPTLVQVDCRFVLVLNNSVYFYASPDEMLQHFLELLALPVE